MRRVRGRRGGRGRSSGEPWRSRKGEPQPPPPRRPNRRTRRTMPSLTAWDGLVEVGNEDRPPRSCRLEPSLGMAPGRDALSSSRRPPRRGRGRRDPGRFATAIMAKGLCKDRESSPIVDDDLAAKALDERFESHRRSSRTEIRERLSAGKMKRANCSRSRARQGVGRAAPASVNPLETARVTGRGSGGRGACCAEAVQSHRGCQGIDPETPRADGLEGPEFEQVRPPGRAPGSCTLAARPTTSNRPRGRQVDEGRVRGALWRRSRERRR